MPLIPRQSVTSALDALARREPLVFANPQKAPARRSGGEFSLEDVEAADLRLRSFAPLLADLFPGLKEAGGIIESPLLSGEPLRQKFGSVLADRPLWIKADSALPVAGSVKARGGIYEVLSFVEIIARKHGLLDSGDYRALATPRARDVLAQYTVVVGSTGNLGFSIGLSARAFGLGAEIHMSSDAKAWKKQRLCEVGATVVEHKGDYQSAVAEARRSCAQSPERYFIDDEDSATLFLGYATAAIRLKQQFEEAGIDPSADAPLIVFLPCGVGGAPGGISFGLNLVFGTAVRTVFVQPVDAPCFALRALRPSEPSVSVYDIGLTNKTIADGMAVPCASDLVYHLVGGLVDGYATVADSALANWVAAVWNSAGLRLEPSGAAGFAALEALLASGAEGAAGFLIWTTGGALLPDDEFQAILDFQGDAPDSGHRDRSADRETK